MPVAIWTFITLILGSLISKILILLGITLVTFTGITLGIDAVQAYVESNVSGLPAYMVQLFGMLHMDTAIAIILAAYAARTTTQFVNGIATRFAVGATGGIWNPQ